MKKICIIIGTFLVTLILFSGGCAFSAAPADVNFGDDLITNTSNSLSFGGLVFSTDGGTDSDPKLSILDYSGASEGGILAFDNTHFIKSVITCDYTGTHNPTMFQFSSADLSNNFKLNSLYVLATMLQSLGASSAIDVKGYDGGSEGTLKASVIGVNLAETAVYGTGNTQVTYTKTINNDNEKGGLLTFGSDWKGIDTVIITDNGSDQLLEIALDSLDFSECDLPFRGYIDWPKASQTVSGIFYVSGWALDIDGITKVEVLIDDIIAGEALYGKSRPDVRLVYPQYENSNSGFAFSMSSKNLTIGKHTLKIRITSDAAVIKQLPAKEFYVSRPVVGYLDRPIANGEYRGVLGINGWVLDPNGVKKIDVYIDDNLSGEALYGIPRSDVYNVYPEYSNSNSGFSFSIKVASIGIGKHTIKIVETGNDNKVNIIAVREVYTSISVIGFLDNPKTNGEYSGSVGVNGWVLDPNGVKKIEVYVDDVLLGEAVYGISRNDVYNVYPEYNNKNSGFNYSIKTEALEKGIHKVKIVETGNNGNTKVIAEREFVLK